MQRPSSSTDLPFKQTRSPVHHDILPFARHRPIHRSSAAMQRVMRGERDIASVSIGDPSMLNHLNYRSYLQLAWRHSGHLKYRITLPCTFQLLTVRDNIISSQGCSSLFCVDPSKSLALFHSLLTSLTSTVIPATLHDATAGGGRSVILVREFVKIHATRRKYLSWTWLGWRGHGDLHWRNDWQFRTSKKNMDG